MSYGILKLIEVIMKRYQSSRTAGINVENNVKRTFDGQPIPMSYFCKAVKIVSNDLNLSEKDIIYISVEDTGLRSGYCTPNGKGIGLDYCLEGDGILETVAHEMRHAWQIKNGLFLGEKRQSINFMLDFSPEGDAAFDEYENLPSEIDAREYARKVIEKYA
jgi:hypothetical protein